MYDTTRSRNVENCTVHIDKLNVGIVTEEQHLKAIIRGILVTANIVKTRDNTSASIGALHNKQNGMNISLIALMVKSNKTKREFVPRRTK